MGSFLCMAVFAGSLAVTGCTTYMRPLHHYEQQELHRVRPTIDDGSEISRYFLQEDRPRLGTAQTRRIEDIVHELLEDTFAAALVERVSFAPIHYRTPGYTLQVARRGGIEIISARILYNEDISAHESEGLEMLADYLGPEIDDVHLASENFHELVRLLEQRDITAPSRRASAQRTIDGYFARHFPGQEPQHAAYMMTIGGFALDFLVYHYVRIDPDQASLHGWVALLAHEIGHTLIFLDADLSYKVQLLAGYLNWSDNEEIVTIHETACNVISDRVTPAFFERHVDPESAAYRAFAQQDEETLQYQQTMREILADYNAMPMHVRIARRDDLFESYRVRLANAGFSPRVINEAYLAVQNRYSGGDHIRERLDAIAGSVGLRDFICIIPYLHTQDDLYIVHARVQDGIRGRAIIEPIEHAHDLVDLGDPGDMPF